MSASINPAPTAPPVVLSAVNLSKSFASPTGEITVLREVNLNITAGETVSIRGESGSGKTTLLYCLAGLEQPDRGELHWEGRPVDARNTGQLARIRAALIGFVFQSYYLVPEMNALENVLLAGRIAGHTGLGQEARARDLLARVGLEKRLLHVPGKLSGGEAQRVAVARALLNRPRLLLADEPTGNLDEETAEEVMGLLLRLCAEEGAALVLVTHHSGFAARTGRALRLAHGGLATA
jgi:predicted ABC-type transport system involved in lysophospholipase L1 biosynthesis ATPase subunit